MQKWEYMTLFVTADIDNENAGEFLKQRWPGWTKPPRYTPQTMIPFLNELGEQGWEIVHMEPVADVGNNADVYFNGEYSRYSHTYFCVMKRPKE